MTATQVTVDENILFILQSFSLNMLHIYITPRSSLGYTE